jgi:hypothetical protein
MMEPMRSSSWTNIFKWRGNEESNKKEITQLLLQQLLDRCAQLGQVGSKCTEAERLEVTTLARKLAPYSVPSPAKYPISGIHKLVHTHSQGGSSGAIGPFVGKVTQEFVDEEKFINAVQIGPLKISLFASRKIMDSNRVRVTFQETLIQFAGLIISRTEAKGQGVWKCLFVGTFYDKKSNKRKLIRIIEAPSLFVLEQTMSS